MTAACFPDKGHVITAIITSVVTYLATISLQAEPYCPEPSISVASASPGHGIDAALFHGGARPALDSNAVYQSEAAFTRGNTAGRNGRDLETSHLPKTTSLLSESNETMHSTTTNSKAGGSAVKLRVADKSASEAKSKRRLGMQPDTSTTHRTAVLRDQTTSDSTALVKAEEGRHSLISEKDREFVNSLTDERLWTRRNGHYAPIIDHKHKLIVCTIPKVACTVWRRMLRRLAGFADWNTTDERITHNFAKMSSGLKYLSDLNDSEADQLMHDPSYKKIAIVRNPLVRILSAWQDKFSPNSIHPFGNTSWVDFALAVPSGCKGDEHWIPQSCFCGMRRWKYDHIAHVEGREMHQLVQYLEEENFLPKDVIETGWFGGRFLETNNVYHKTNADAHLIEYYNNTSYPGVFDYLSRAVKEDVLRYNYSAEVTDFAKQVAST